MKTYAPCIPNFGMHIMKEERTYACIICVFVMMLPTIPYDTSFRYSLHHDIAFALR